MKKPLHAVGLMLALGLATACASAGGGPGPLEARFTRDFGRLLVPALEEARNKVWSRHNYHLRRQEQDYNAIYYESEWRPWALADEGGEATPGRIRIIIRGRRVASEMDGSGLFRVTFDGEYEAVDAMGDWRPMSPPEVVREEFEKVAGDLALEVRTGIRR